jgi:phage shock protein PspC (stress-responsive transcriptional regulator)
MRTVITISLNGNAYQLEAVGCDALRAYLQVAEQRLAGNPDHAEILADLEQAIADKCGRYLGPHKNVISADEMAEVLREMGPVDGGAGEGAGPPGSSSGQGAGAHGTFAAEDVFGAAGSAGSTGPSGAASAGWTANRGSGAATASSGTEQAGAANASGGAPRRLYQIREGALISGVCTGLAAYLNVDVSIVRILFVVMTILTGGVWILIYVVMMFVIPYAETSEQRAAAHGWPFNAEELIARAKAHYSQLKNSAKWQRQQWREQRRMWKYQRWQQRQQQRAWERWGGSQGVPPPPPPPPGGGQPPNMNYSAQVVHGVLTPIAELLGVVLFFVFLFSLLSLVARHRIFGWTLPGDIPLWVGIVLLIVLYRVIASPLRQARYAAYYGAPLSHGWLALWGVLVWLGLVTFLVWLAWQHWYQVQDFLQHFADTWHSFIEQLPITYSGPERAAMSLLPGVPACVLQAGEFQAHG